MVVAVALALHDELAAVPRQELDGVHRLDVFVAGFAIQFSNAFARRGVVRHQTAVVLVAIQLEHVDGLGIRTPRDVGEVDGLCVGDKIAGHTAIGRLEIDGLAGG